MRRACSAPAPCSPTTAAESTTVSALLQTPTGLRAFFAGLISSDQNHDGGLSTATSADGVTWAVQPTLASQSDGSGNEASSVYAAGGIGATLFSNGTPLSIWGDTGSGYHVGTAQSTPDVRYTSSFATAADPDAATDAATGAVAIAWNDIDLDTCGSRSSRRRPARGSRPARPRTRPAATRPTSCPRSELPAAPAAPTGSTWRISVATTRSRAPRRSGGSARQTRRPSRTPTAASPE